MKCDRCYYENPDDETYCINCGKKLPEKTKPTVITVITIPSKNKEKKENDYYSIEYKGPEITTQNQNNTNNDEDIENNDLIAIFLSFLFPGFGHLYIKQNIKGIIYLFIAIILGYISTIKQEVIYVLVVVYLIQVMDVIICCRRKK
ncbi:TM2 domain-containing protein [Candidatus Methanosphaera massiliense]|jgi:TM2 domain-containing membrane protein YozV|uniref:TM2 domain-containing protein n=1 Tax=Methanosphaera TaxID=2316 RepID=UPI0023804732|nr:zinc-ribbon domain-containing protein [Candidatus Methanosphaera massiliense]MDD6285397.1 hypothetical protein [Methanobacteriaceae archaeon]MDE4077451.1 hypothetical protein [Candidatus Methanosphaera massiliense]